MSTRYVGHWIAKADEFGDQYGSEICLSRDKAYSAAVKHAKACNEMEWVEVREQEWNESIERWETVARWYGDYDGLVQDEAA